MARALNEADSSKKKLTVEGQDLARQIEDAEAYIAELGKTKISLTTQVHVKLNILPDAKQLSSGCVSVERKMSNSRAVFLHQPRPSQICFSWLLTKHPARGVSLF